MYTMHIGGACVLPYACSDQKKRLQQLTIRSHPDRSHSRSRIRSYPSCHNKYTKYLRVVPAGTCYEHYGRFCNVTCSSTWPINATCNSATKVCWLDNAGARSMDADKSFRDIARQHSATVRLLRYVTLTVYNAWRSRSCVHLRVRIIRPAVVEFSQGRCIFVIQVLPPAVHLLILMHMTHTVVNIVQGQKGSELQPSLIK